MKLYLRMFWVMLMARFRASVPAIGPCETPFRVLPNDLDVNLHMNNGVYLTIADLGRLDMMLRSGLWKRVRQRGWYPVVARQSIRFRRSLLPFERYVIESRVVGYDDRSIFVEQRFRRKDETVATLIVDARILGRDGAVTPLELLEAIDVEADSIETPPWAAEWVTLNRHIEEQSRR